MLLCVGRAVVVGLLLAVVTVGGLRWHQGGHRGQGGHGHRVRRLRLGGVSCVVVGGIGVLVVGILVLTLGCLVLVFQQGRVLASSNHSGRRERVDLVTIIHVVVDGRGGIVEIGGAIGEGLVLVLLGQLGEGDQVVVKRVDNWEIHLDHGCGGRTCTAQGRHASLKSAGIELAQSRESTHIRR